MRRREFLTLVATLGAGGRPQLLCAEPVNGKIGYLHPITISPTHITFSLLQREWRRLGYVDGETVFARSGEDDPHLLPKLVAELIHQGVGVLIVVGADAVRAAAKDDAFGIAGGYLVERRVVRQNLAIDVALANPPCDQLGVLRPKIENDD